MSIEKDTRKYYEHSKERSYLHPVIQAFSVPKYKWISQQINLKNKTFLEVGGGNGYFSQHFEKETNLTVLDISKNQLDSNPASNKIIGSAYNLPFEDNSFDIVFCSNLLHHLENPLQAIKEMARVSKKQVIISEPNIFNPILFLGSLIIKHERGALKSSKEFLTKLLNQANLKIIKHTFIGGIVMPNGTPEFVLPFSNPSSKSKWSFFQIFITEKE